MPYVFALIAQMLVKWHADIFEPRTFTCVRPQYACKSLTCCLVITPGQGWRWQDCGRALRGGVALKGNTTAQCVLVRKGADNSCTEVASVCQGLLRHNDFRALGPPQVDDEEEDDADDDWEDEDPDEDWGDDYHDEL